MERKPSKPTAAGEAKALRDRLVNDRRYLAEIDEAVNDFEKGKSKTLEDLEMTRQKRNQNSGK